ncbi:unnamed protein product [Schistosoma turkestanicum]|nr:unnamed protein product [Schistosoma turkestanicum]
MQQACVNPQIANIFNQVDQNRNGTISADELQRALANGLNTPFNIKTIELMMCMFDRDMSGTMNLNEFAQLFGYIQQWQQCFQSFDRDRSGSMNSNEFHTALTTFGYRLSGQFAEFLVRKFDRRRCGSIGFDDFICACVCLKNLTDGFKVYDHQRSGMAQFKYEEFLTVAFSVVS